MLTARPADVVLPETVQGIIAARLDTLEREEKQLLQEAAVIGRVFWLGSLAGERWRLEERLHSLERKEFVSRERRSAVAGEVEYAFRHALVRDVAYEQIPKAERGDKHLRVARWLASLGRPEDHAELLAHHYLSALELAIATGGDTSGFSGPAMKALRDAGDRALALQADAAAARFYDASREYWPVDDVENPELLFRLGRALAGAGDERADDALGQARDALIAAGARARAAEASTLLADLWWYRGRRDRAGEHVDEARELIAHEDRSSTKAWVLARLARHLWLAGEHEAADTVGREALELAELLDLDETRAHVLSTIGSSRFQAGDMEGLADLEQSVEISREIDSPELARGYHNLGHILLALGQIRRSSELRGQAVVAGERYGQWRLARWSGASQMTYEYLAGDWDASVAAARAFLEESERLGGWYQDAFVLGLLALVEMARGEDAAAREHARQALERAQAAADPQAITTMLAHAALVEFELGAIESARSHAQTSLRSGHRLPTAGAGRAEALLAPLAADLGIEGDLRAHMEAAPPEDLWAPAVRAVLDGEYARAADLYHGLELLPFEARARLGAAERLHAQGRHGDAAKQLDRSLAFFRSVGAARYVRRGEVLLAMTA